MLHPSISGSVCRARGYNGHNSGSSYGHRHPSPRASAVATGGSAAEVVTSVSKTEEIFTRVDRLGNAQASGAGGRTTFDAFQAADSAWIKLRNMPEGQAAGPAPQFVSVAAQPLSPATRPTYDIVICGGTLGIFAAVALQRAGLHVAVLERGPVVGRNQEWNLSRKELHELAKVGIATVEELEECVSTEFNPVRAGFYPDVEVWTRDVLNLGVSPAKLVAKMRSNFETAGGVILENTDLQGIAVHPDGCLLAVKQRAAASAVAASASSDAPSGVTSRLVIDCMGHASPVVKQLRWGRKPDGVCAVVGTLASGFANNKTGDVIVTASPLQPPGQETSCLQYFWEAFPAGTGPSDRTTYMFTYMDAQSWRPSLAAIFDDYWRLMPQYQGVDLDALEFKRVLFGVFPTFRASPLKPGFDRVLQMGDASGIQSPLSFGGFGALTRHLGRIVTATTEALQVDALDARSLGLIQAYNPALSSAWMLQRAMSQPRRDRPPPANLINQLLGNNFKAMQRLGEPVMKPFLQDVIQPGPMALTLLQQMLVDPLGIPPLLAHVGVFPLLDWTRHFLGMVLFSLLYKLLGPALMWLSRRLSPRQRYKLLRTVEAWEFGSGQDYRP